MLEYLYRNDNNNERQQAEKNITSCLQGSKPETNITRFYRRFSLAQLHHVTAVNLFRGHKLFSFFSWQKQLSTSSIRSRVRSHEKKCKFVTTCILNLAKYGHRLYHVFYNANSHSGVTAFCSWIKLAQEEDWIGFPMIPFFPGSVPSDGNKNCTTTSYHFGPNSAQWSHLGLRVGDGKDFYFFSDFESFPNQIC